MAKDVKRVFLIQMNLNDYLLLPKTALLLFVMWPFLLFLWIGLRVKEISSLTIQDIINNDEAILDDVNLKRAITKGDKQRHVYISTRAGRVCALPQRSQKEAFTGKAPLSKTQRGSRFHPDVLQK